MSNSINPIDFDKALDKALEIVFIRREDGFSPKVEAMKEAIKEAIAEHIIGKNDTEETLPAPRWNVGEVHQHKLYSRNELRDEQTVALYGEDK